MAIYDLYIKLEALKALVGGGILDDDIAAALFPVSDVAERRNRFSRIKSGELPLQFEHTVKLSEEFNSRIVKRLDLGSPGPVILRPDDWVGSSYELFKQLARQLGKTAPQHLARAHAGALDALMSLAKERRMDHSLVVEEYFEGDPEQYRMPESAEPLDPLELPARLDRKNGMTIRLQRSVSAEPMRAWLFFVRDPDLRKGTLSPYLWEDGLENIVFWHAGGPFELSPGYTGLLPGFPARIRDLTGTITAFLLVEPTNSPAVTDLLSKPTGILDPWSPPSFEAFAHLVTCSGRLFQKGNSKKYENGGLLYRPPQLLVRRYVVS